MQEMSTLTWKGKTMSMTKADFIALADHLRPVRIHLAPEVQKALADFCKSRNAAFMADRWTSYLDGARGPNGRKIDRTR